MAKFRFTEADVKRAQRGATKGGMDVATMEIRPDGSILLTAKSTVEPDADDSQELLRLVR